MKQGKSKIRVRGNGNQKISRMEKCNYDSEIKENNGVHLP
jgi:hypothetical protein